MLTTQSLPGSGIEGHGALLSRAQGHFTCSINAVWTFSISIADARGGNKRKLLNNSINPLCLLFLCLFSNSSIVSLLNENDKTISFLGDLFKLYKRVRDLTSSLLDFLKVFPIILGFAACASPRDLVAREIRSTSGKSRSLPVYSVYNCAEHPRVVGKGFDCSI